MDVVLAYGIEQAPASRGHVVVIDVLRAFTCAAFAFSRGAEAIVLVSTTDEAFAVKSTRPDVLMMGEVGGRIIPGFDFGNSPHDLRTADLAGRTIVQRTGSGTQGVVSAKQADAIYLGSLPVASATCRHLRNIGAETVTLLAMGAPKAGSDGPEDLACRAFMADVLAGREPDRARAIREVTESPSGQHALDPAIDWTVPGDVVCATDVDAFDFAMPVKQENGLLVARRADVPHPFRWNGRMRFEIAAVLARRRLDQLPSDEIPAAAEVLIRAGFVTDALCSLVGVTDESPSVAETRLDSSLRELGLELDDWSALVVRSIELARSIVHATGDVEAIAGRLAMLGTYWERTPFPAGTSRRDWTRFFGDPPDFGWRPATESELRAEAAAFIEKYCPSMRDS